MKTASTILLFVFFALSCNSSRSTYKLNSDTKIIFGEGGGIVGGVSQYVIFHDGTVLFEEKHSGNKMEEKNKWSRKEIKSILKEMKKIDFYKMDYMHSGNLYRFIGLEVKDSMHTVMWELNDKKVNPAIPEMYKKLNALVNKTND